jgi:tRNA (mo5U34)-methyltransferase
MPMTPEQIEREVVALGPWFHNLNLGGVQTARDHFLGDFPEAKWRRFQHALPEDLSGKTVLDIGCNGGFYSIQMKQRGAERVVGIDFDSRYLAQARLAAQVTGYDIEFQEMSVYDVAQLGEQFDIVLFMGVLYHLRHPLLALDLIREHVASDLLVFQSLQRGSDDVYPVAADYDFSETAHFDEPGYPKLHFIEHEYANDWTNWWVPNAACSAAMLRAAGFQVIEHPETDVFLCRACEPPTGLGAVYPARFEPDLQANGRLGARRRAK